MRTLTGFAVLLVGLSSASCGSDNTVPFPGADNAGKAAGTVEKSGGGNTTVNGGSSAVGSGGIALGSGGTMPTGGTGSSGKASGGANTGGTATGTGGKATGGATVGGGTSSGGTTPGSGGTMPTGGTGSSGKASGGTNTGGAANTGGTATGGTATGGNSTGGTIAGSETAYMPAFIIGADISGVQQAEDRGMKYKDVDGSTPSGTTSTGGGILTILKNHGFNYVRLRIWVNPSGGYCDLAHTVKFAAGVKQAGMGLLLDFHYSDTWADPGNQTKPAAWANLSFADLTTQVYSHTKDVITQLKAGNGRPDMVQVGNEIPQGLLFDASGATGGNGGKVSGQAFGNLAALLSAGIRGIKEVDSNIKIVMHLDRCDDLAVNEWWISGVQGQGVQFDILGESCYDRANYQQPASDWAPTLSSLASTYPNLLFMAAEYSDSKQLVNDTFYNIPNKRGLGTFIWEPTSWGETIFDSNGQALSQYMTIYDNIAATYGKR